MKNINKWLYGPTPEERVREWRRKLRQNQREVDREIMNVCFHKSGRAEDEKTERDLTPARPRNS